MKLTDEQLIAAKHKDGPCLVLAVPGSGKTTMILERIKLLSKNTGTDKILSLTFSKSQALDMKNRFENNKANFMTIHAFCYLIIRNYLKKYNKEIRLLESDNIYNKFDLVRNIYRDVNGKKISKEDLNLFFQETGFMKNNLEDESYLKNVEIKNINIIYKRYENFKKEKFYIDFDDMQVVALKLLENGNLLRAIKRKYKYFQLDEGQDTSLIQFKILEKIIYPENNLLIVADDDQSIYSFRASNPKYLLNFKNMFPDAKILTLSQNHRSQRNIVITSEKFIKFNKNRYKKNVFTNKNPSSKIILNRFNNFKDEYEFIKQKLNPSKKTAILYRNNISSLNFISYLIEDTIDFSIVSNKFDFFESKIFLDIINIIRFSEDLNNIELFLEIYYKVETYLDKKAVNNLSIKALNKNIIDFLLDTSLKEYQIEALIKLEKELKHLKTLPLARKISFIYSSMGYKNYIEKVSKKYNEETYNKDVYIESFINFSENIYCLDDLYEKIEKTKKVLKLKKNSKLFLSTIHSSKGLEYDDVFIVDLVNNEFPIISYDKNSNESLEEERRIFYVAMTRAKENLYLLSLKTRNRKKVKPSSFYLDIKNINK